MRPHMLPNDTPLIGGGCYLAYSLVVECGVTGRSITVQFNKPRTLAEVSDMFKEAQAKTRRHDDRRIISSLCNGVARVTF